nr:GFA family protein [Snodgrassella sp. CFCC 13594]
MNQNVTACHCSLCRRQSGGINMNIHIKEGSLRWITENYVSIYQSSERGERGFCNHCGTSLFWRTQDQKFCNINVFCIVHNNDDLILKTQIYIDNKPSFYEFRNETTNLTEADVIALYSAKN